MIPIRSESAISRAPNPPVPRSQTHSGLERRHDSLAIIAQDDGVERPAPGAPPTAFRIWKAGLNMTDKGPTLFTQRSAELLMQEQALRGNWYSFDVDHMSLDQSAPPENHKAVGRHRLEVRNGELWVSQAEFAEFVRCGLQADPPEWMYFSPAYDLDRETNEVVSYLNTALTNNPATWNVTQLATRGNGHMALSKKDMITAFEHMAKGEMDAGSMSSFATAMLAMISSGAVKAAEGDALPPDAKEPDGDEGKAPEKAPDGDGDEEAKKASVSKTDSRVIQLLESIERERAEERKARAKEAVETERKTLLASRQIVNVDVRKWLEDPNTSIDSVRAACRVMPPVEVPNLAAAVSVQATRGSSVGAKVDPAIATEIDAKMGIRSSGPAIRREDGGRTHVLGALYGKQGQDEAKRILAIRDAKEGV